MLRVTQDDPSLETEVQRTLVVDADHVRRTRVELADTYP